MRRNVRTTRDYKDREETKRDSVLSALRTKTPQQIDAYINSNVTNLASAKVVLKTLAKAVAYLSRKL